MDETRTIAWLSTLTDKQFVEFFYRAVVDRKTSDRPEGNGHFVLADAEKLPDEPWWIDFIGLPDGDEYEDNCPI